jgi:hypothetical protein
MIRFTALLVLVISGYGAAQGAQSAGTNNEPTGIESLPNMTPEATAAYCIGSSEASLGFLSEVIYNSAAKYPAFNASPLKKAAEADLLSMNRLTAFLIEHGYLRGARDATEILAARREGIASAQRCYRDQAGYVACQAKCAAEKSGVESHCVEQCKLPASCQIPNPCPAFEKALSRPSQ